MFPMQHSPFPSNDANISVTHYSGKIRDDFKPGVTHRMGAGDSHRGETAVHEKNKGKLLKAHIAEVTQMIPIKTHDFIYLVKKSELELPENHIDFVGKINTASIPTRYPDDLQRS